MNENLPSPKKPTVALLVENSRAYGREICLGVAEYARQHGEWNFIVHEHHQGDPIPEWLDSWQGDGVIGRISDLKTTQAFHKAGFPVVDTFGQRRDDEIPYLDTDAHAVANMAARFFVNAAFKNFAYCGFPGLWFSDERCVEFKKIMKTYGSEVIVYEPPASWETTDVTHRETLHQEGSKELENWIKDLPDGTAVLACNDIRAQQLIRVAERCSRKIPEEIAVMGVDDDEIICELTNPRLTSIKPNAHILGYTAAHWLHQLMQNKPLPSRSLLVPPKNITERASTDIIASDDLIFVNAVRYIRNHVQDGIDVGEVVRNSTHSRSSIETRFKKNLGRSIKDEITRARIARSVILLRETSMTLQQVAEACGFATASHFSRLFKQSEGMTPGCLRNSVPLEDGPKPNSHKP